MPDRTPGGRHGATQWSVSWKNFKGEVRQKRRTNTRLMVEDVLLLRWNHSNDFPITICNRRVGEHQWDLSCWDELVAALREPDREELRVRQGWIEPVDR